MRKNLLKARKDEDLTQVEISKILGISDRYYRALEAGTSNGSVKLWDKLEDLLGVSQRQLRDTE